ncbi:MAG: cation diffusion facilitator family transporter [Clostridiales bacterium]|nr:cation diffusion facilitator family transporter [Clostridiales bacterium]
MTTKKQTQKIPRKTEKNESETIRHMTQVSLSGNAALSAFKLFAGIFGHSGAMISDAIHSLSDVLTTLIAWVGVKMSQKEADADHPYGHERLECVASLALGAVLLATGLAVGKAGLQKIFSGETLAVPGAIALAAAVVSILAKEGMYHYTLYHAKRINSSAFIADAWHHRSDALSSVGSLIGIGGAMLGFPVLDSVASVVICVFIVKVAYDILKDAVTGMLDTSCGVSYEQKLSDYIAGQEGVVCVDVLHSRRFANKVYIDLEIEVDGERRLTEAHAVAEQIHTNVERDFPDIKHIMIHVNPAKSAGEETMGMI